MTTAYILLESKDGEEFEVVVSAHVDAHEEVSDITYLLPGLVETDATALSLLCVRCSASRIEACAVRELREQAACDYESYLDCDYES